MSNYPRVPIKVVFPSDGDYKAPHSGGSPPKVFVKVTKSLRDSLAGQATGAVQHFEQSFRRNPDVPAVAKVTLRRAALAKSHRPENIFNEATCPVIGVDDVGKLLVSVTARGIAKVASVIKDGDAVATIANISAIESIMPWTATDTRGGQETAQLVEHSSHQRKPALRCKLFRHRDPISNEAVRRAFVETVQSLGLPAPTEVRYSPNSTVFALKVPPSNKLEEISRFVGLQSVLPFPTYRIVRTTAQVLGSVTADRLPPPVAGATYGLVGVIDSGTDPKNSHLQAWIAERLDWVPRAQQDNTHGSFVVAVRAIRTGLGSAKRDR